MANRLTAAAIESALEAALLKQASVAAQDLLERQVQESGPDQGGFRNARTGWCEGREAGYALATLCEARSVVDRLPDSPEVSKLDAAIEHAAGFVFRRMGEDGLLDLGGNRTSNEAGFIVPGVALGLEALQAAAPSLADRVAPLLRRIVTLAARAVVAGDAFSANHRWTAACAALASAHAIDADPRYLEKIQHYLADGIDCDADGFWFEERSPNYNMVANEGMIVLADRLGREDLKQVVVRSCVNALLMRQPSGEADTSLSLRQDRDAPGRPPAQAVVLAHAATWSQDGRLSTLLAEHLEKGRVGRDVLPPLLALTRTPIRLPEPQPLAREFDLISKSLHVARHRRDDVAVTLQADPGGNWFERQSSFGHPRRNETLATISFGEDQPITIAAICFAIAGTPGLQPERIEPIGQNAYRLTGSTTGYNHLLQFRPGAPTVRISNPSHHTVEVRPSESMRRFDLKLQADATTRTHGALVFFFRGADEMVDTMQVRPLTRGDAISITQGGVIEIRNPRRAVRISGLPRPEHIADLPVSRSIPSRLHDTCARVSIGVRLPASIQFTIELLD